MSTMRAVLSELALPLRVIIASVTFSLVACERSPSTVQGPASANGDARAAEGRPTPAAPTSTTPAGPSTSDTCAAIRARFNAVHAARTDDCVSDADCGCFNPVGGPHLGCSGVTDVATANKLQDIQREFHAASCPWTHNCAAQLCAPKCRSGRCSR